MKHRNTSSSDDGTNGYLAPAVNGNGSGGSNAQDQQMPARNWSLVIIVTHINIFLYSSCFWIQLGSLPYLSKKLGVNPVWFGYLQTTFAVVQLCGGPIFGRFGDLYGSRLAMSLAFASSALTYFLVWCSTSMPLLFLSRLPSVFMHAMQGGQMVVTDVVDSRSRADALGKLGISYGLGMIVGPAVGGLITKNYEGETAALVAAFGSIASVALSLYFLPQHIKKESVQHNEHASVSSVFSISKLVSLFKHPMAILLLTIKLITGVPIGIIQSMFTVVLLEKFQLSADQNGFMMSYIGLVSMCVQGLVIGFLASRFGEMALIKFSTFVLLGAYLLLAYVETVWQMCAVMLPLTFGLTLMNVIITSALTHTVSDHDTGAMLGVSMAVNSLIRTLSPTVGGIIYSGYGFEWFGYLGFIDSIVALVVLYLQTETTIRTRPIEY